MSEYRRGGRSRALGRGVYDNRQGGRRGGSDGGHGGYDNRQSGGRGGYDRGRGGGRHDYYSRGGGDAYGHGAPSRPPQDDNWPEVQSEVPERLPIPEAEKPGNPFRSKSLKDFVDLKIDRSIEYREKPEPGTNGCKIALITNYFRLMFSLPETIFVHHYDVTIEKQKASSFGDGGAIPGPKRRTRKLEKRLNRQIIDKMARDYGDSCGLFDGIIPVYDSDKNLYIKRELDASSKYAITDNELCTFIVSIKHVAKVEVNPKRTIFPADAIQFVDIVLRYGPTRDKIPIGSKLFFPNPDRRNPLPMNKELAFGFYQSARNCEGGLMLNVDRAASVIHTGGALLSVFRQCIKGIEQYPRIPAQLVREMTKELQGMRVKVTHLRYPMKVRVHEFSLQPASELRFNFELKDESGIVISGQRITVEEYFKITHKKELRQPHLPCLVTGSEEAPKYFPLEVCELLPDQYVAKKLHATVLSEMTKMAASQKPNARFNEISESLKSIKKDGGDYNKQFGIDISSNIVQVEGRVLDAPRLRYGGECRLLPPGDCSWMMQKPEAKRFYNSVSIEQWILVDMSRGNPSLFPLGFLEDFANRLTQTAATLGVQMGQPLFYVRYNFVNTTDLRIEVFEIARSLKVKLMVFLIPEEDACYYAVKKLGDLDFGIVTQCCSTKHYNRDYSRNALLKVAYLTNLMLKINAKMNGVNTVLDVDWVSKHKIMFVGIDVTHPAPGDRYSLSIASCVGSYDCSFVRYEAKLTAQEQTRRETVNLDRMMKELLAAYRQHNGYFPETIIVYRDGVADGQFDQVMAFEVTKLTQLFKEMEISTRLTYIIVQKRHHTRFLPLKKSEATRSSNVPAGTTVDTIVTDPLKFDFYICSHYGLLGTSRPSRYWVLYDQNGFTADIIQQITFFMCFLYPRCTRSVSIPVPVQFAHLSAYRARHHVIELFGESSVPSISSVGDEEAKAEQERERQEYTERLNNSLRVQPNLSNRLYYL